jgi:Nucleotidyl transferase AbiEii toxin, Type IV TA system
MLIPRLDILPAPQRRLWPELKATTPDFTLYGGTAIALRLGHRQSVDFDFFSVVPFEPAQLMARITYLRGAVIRQSAANTLTCTVERGGPVQLSFFGGLSLGQVGAPEQVEGPGFSVASPIDLAGMKAAVITQRAEIRDYLDIHALMITAGIALSAMLAAAAIIYGPEFNPLLSLKALAYHDDPALAELSAAVRRDLIAAIRRTDPQNLPVLAAIRQRGERP